MEDKEIEKIIDDVISILAKGEYEKGLQKTNKLLEKYPDEFAFLELKAEILILLDKPDDAIVILKKLKAIDNEYPPILMSLARCYDQKEDFHKVIKYIKKINKYDYDNPLKDFLLAEAYFEVENFKKAIKYYEKYNTENPHDTPFYPKIAHLYFLLRKLKKAYNAYQKAIELKQNYPQVYLETGMVCFVQNDFSKAIEYYTKYIDNFPTHSDGYALRAEAYNVIGDKVKAKADEQKAINLNSLN